MKKFFALAFGAALGFAACVTTACSSSSVTREGEGEYHSYTLSDVVMTQQSVSTYAFEFSVDCAGDEVDVYFTQNDRIMSTDIPVDVESAADGQNVRFSFIYDLQLSEEYYLWVVGEENEVMLPITAPSMFPSMERRLQGGAIFYFNYTYGVSWSSFCDPEGKSVWVSQSTQFDETATALQTGLAITQEECVISADNFSEDLYYYSVTTAKNGLLTIISCPVALSDSVYAQFTGMRAKINSDVQLEVEVDIAPDGEIDQTQAQYLQLVVKSGAGDEIYSADSVYANGAAVMTFDCTLLLEEGLWYDMCLAYRGAIICDVPKQFGSSEVNVGSAVIKDGATYDITDWKEDGAPEEDSALKVYFDTINYADEFCDWYEISLKDGGELTLVVRLKLKDGVNAPTLGITSGTDYPLPDVASGTLDEGEDGVYVYELPIYSAIASTDVWYDIRLFFGDTVTELLSNSCMDDNDFYAIYEYNGRQYQFRDWNGLLKLERIL